VRAVGVFFLAVYRAVISPLYPPCCRYVPTCSEYARDAVQRFGLIRGGLLAVLRILRCQPLFSGGLDPVPEAFPSWPWRARRS
jgi:hypothetical protein